MNRLIREWTIGCMAISMLVAAARGEVYPTGSSQPLFKTASFLTPPLWQLKTLPDGKTYRQVVSYGSFKATIETDDGPMPFAEQPWAREAIVRVLANQIRDPDVFNDLLENKTNPIIFFGQGAYVESFMYPGRSQAEIDEYFNFVLKTKEDFGSRFLCMDYGEWTWGGVSRNKPTRELASSCELLKLPLPKTRDEAAHWFDLRYDLVFKRYQDAQIPVLSFNCTTLNHHEARRGASYTGNEIAYGNPAHDSTFLAFCRGASRQYDIPWGSYAAGFGGHFGHNSFTGKSPDERLFRHDRLRGAYTAVPMQEQRRTMYTLYMAGGNFLIKESDGGQGMLAGFNPQTVEQAEPRIVALAETKRYAGPYAMLCAELWDNIVTKRDRGVPYTPVALMFDRNHGLAFKYSKVLAVGAVPYATADEQMRAVLNTVFPYEGAPPEQVYFGRADYRAGPFGEIFDAITTDASAAVVKSYRAIVLLGKVDVDARLASVLKQFVAQGGLLLMVCEQMTPPLWKLAGITDTGEMGQDTSYLRASDFYVYSQRHGYEYHKVKLTGAQPLFVAGKYGQRNWPVATLNRVGDGGVIVATPVWLNVKGDPTRTHSLFSELMTMIAAELAPVRVLGDEVKVMYNRNAAGWVVTLMNNRGHSSAYPGFKPAERQYDTAAVILKPRFDCDEAVEWTTGATLADGDASQVALTIPPGDIRIVEFKEKTGPTTGATRNPRSRTLAVGRPGRHR